MMVRKPHIVWLTDGWWCAGHDGTTPLQAYLSWFIALGKDYPFLSAEE